MNEGHAELCGSAEWAEYLQSEIMPGAIGATDLGAELVEVGPGPGASTDWLRHRVDRLTAVELEADAADRLSERFAATNVTVINADATALPMDDGSFDAAAAFTMLHHVPTTALQNRLLAELLRVLKPGGVLVASDSLPSDPLHHFHEGDTYNPVDPGTLLVRLQTLGYERITLSVDQTLSFRAHKPLPAVSDGG